MIGDRIHRSNLPRILLFLTIARTLSACGPKGTTPEPEEPAPPATPKTTGAQLTAKMLGELETAAGCPSTTSPYRVWCIAADGWDQGTAAPLPDGEHVYVGLSAGLIEDESIEDGLTGNVFFTVLGVKNTGGKVTGLITDINPKGVDERNMVAQATADVTEVLKGKRDMAHLPKPLYEWIAKVAPAADHPMIQDERGWRLEGAARAELRKVGAFWVALEQPTEGPPGLFVSIFTDQIDVKP